MCDLYPLTFYFVSPLRLNFLIFDFLSLLVSCVSRHISTESQMPISPFTPFLDEASVHHRLIAILSWKFDLDEISQCDAGINYTLARFSPVLVMRVRWECDEHREHFHTCRLCVQFVTDLLSRVLMICGSLMAVINGLIPSLGAMIYGNLTDELVIRKTRNCTLNESVTMIILENLVAYEMLEPQMIGTNVTMTNSIEITVNETGVRVEVIGLDGSRLNERFLANTSIIWLNGTALNGTELIGVDLRGTNFATTETKKIRKEDEKKSADIEGNISEKHNRIQELDIGGGNSLTNQALITRLSEDVNRRLQEKRMTQNSLENGYFEGLRKKRDVAFLDTALHHTLIDSYRIPRGLIGDNSRNNADIITYFTGSEFPEFHKNMIEDEREKENKETQPTYISNEIKIGKEESINKLFPPTPKPVILPPTKNVTYILRNITKSCRWYENNIEENMRKYALYYVYAAFATLVFAYGQTVLWNIASEIGVRSLSENLTDTVMHKDPGFYDTKISEGVPNFEGIT